MNAFDIAFKYVLSNETNKNDPDEVIDNPRDPGGMTKYGISLRFLRSIDMDRLRNYCIYSTDPSDLINLSLDQAKALYKGEFWDHAPFHDISNQNAVNFIFDMAVNMGISPAIKCAQRACWSVMKKRGIIEDDGILGNETLSLINQCGVYLLPAMRSERAGYYKIIVEHNPAQKEFIDGWLNRSYGV
jgi:lysozyme family protein